MSIGWRGRNARRKPRYPALPIGIKNLLTLHGLEAEARGGIYLDEWTRVDRRGRRWSQYHWLVSRQGDSGYACAMMDGEPIEQWMAMIRDKFR